MKISFGIHLAPGAPFVGRSATSPEGVRQYFHHVAGERFKVKDLRTWTGTAVAIQALKDLPPPKNAREFKMLRNEVGDRVSRVLGNTRTMALGAYIDPTVFKGVQPNA
jgi:DNA topoisomerase I